MDDHDPDIFSAYPHCIYFGADFLKDLASALGEDYGAEHADAAENKVADREHDITPDEDADQKSGTMPVTSKLKAATSTTSASAIGVRAIQTKSKRSV